MLFQLSSYFNVFTFLFVVFSSLFGADGTVPSPKASTDLICHTDRAGDCYPSTFQPTEEFQVIKDDQALPPGLHVRMNLATGVKEARLNVPEPEEAHSDLVIIEKPEPEESSSDQDEKPIDDSAEDLDHLHYHDQSILNSPPRIRDPPFEPGEAATFESNMAQLRTSPSEDDLIPALTALEDLCHSADWGLKLTKDSKVTRVLVHVFGDVSRDLAVRSVPALLLATAIQNNPDALTAALAHFYNDEWPTGPLEAVLVALAQEHCPRLLIRTVFLLSNLCQSPEQMIRFINAGGLEILLRVFENQDLTGHEGDKLRGKIANFILDHVVELDLAVPSVPTADVENADPQTGDQASGEDESWVLIHNSKSVADPQNVEHDLKKWDIALTRGSGATAAVSESLESAKLALRQRLARTSS